MDSDRFDALTRIHAVSGSRRLLLGGFALGVLGFAGRQRAEAASCRGVGRTCREDANCCGLCNGRDAAGRRICSACGLYILAGADGPTSEICVDDDVTIYLNGLPIYVDNDVTAGCYPPSAPFAANIGDTVRVVADNSFGGDRSIEGITLYCAVGQGRQVLHGDVTAPYEDAFPGTFGWFDTSSQIRF